MSLQAPKSLMQVLQTLNFEEALSAGDPRNVDTQEARGSQKTYAKLAKLFGYKPNSGDFYPPATSHVLFFGHVGSGKTTELRRYARDLDDSRHFYVVEVDVLSKLDSNNLQYSETLLAMAEALCQKLMDDGYSVSDDTLKPIHDWFQTAITSRTENTDHMAELRSEAEIGGGLPGIFKLLSKLTASAKTGSSHKQEWRNEVRNRFTALADAFNALLADIEQTLAEQQRANRILFLLDGTDKMKGEDTEQFFIQDAAQLVAINSFVIYTAPLYLKYSGRPVTRLHDLVLPMIKLDERDGSPCTAGRSALRELLLRRADHSLFASDTEIEKLVELCGGHPRELLRLLRECCLEADDDVIDGTVVEAAAKRVASDYRRFLQPDDYQLLASLDADPQHGGNTEAIQNLLHNLALLEYNDGSWRRSHPLVKTLEGYQAAHAKLASPPNP